MTFISIASWLAFWTAAGIAVFAAVTDMLRRAGMTRPNFAGRLIPIGAGVGFALLAIPLALAFTLRFPQASLFGNSFLALVLGFALLGFLDDAARERERGGFRGHIARLVRERTVSTALVKAAFGLCLSVVAAAVLRRGWTALTDGLLIALCANAVNLLDVKPGRALKGFLGGFAVVLGGSYVLQWSLHRATVTGGAWILLVPFVLWALVFARYDLTCRAMLGDAGSNVLGAALGMLCVLELSERSRLLALAMLAMFHVVTEIVPLSDIISRFRILRWADGLFVMTPREEGGGNADEAAADSV